MSGGLFEIKPLTEFKMGLGLKWAKGDLVNVLFEQSFTCRYLN